MFYQLLTILLLISSCLAAQPSAVNHQEIKEDFEEILKDIEQHYVYLNDKEVSLDCIRDYYGDQIKQIESEEETVLFFEYLLNEFYDNHIYLKTHRSSSFRQYAPIYATYQQGIPTISQVWQSQIDTILPNILGAEIVSFNQIPIEQAINNFPTHCHDKNNPEVKEWIINKILAGRYNEPRLVDLKLPNNQLIQLNLDDVKVIPHNKLLSTSIEKNIGIIRIHNSLGNDDLVSAFDSALSQLSNTKALILDLRNTVNGGDTYEARGIMGRFISTEQAYQKHAFYEVSHKNPVQNPKIKRSWVEYASPRGTCYTKPLVVLVGRWTGSMGEGIAIGLEGMKRATVVGTEMRRLAGEVFGFSFKHQKFGYSLSGARLYHLNGTLREEYIPKHFIHQTQTDRDEALQMAIELLDEKISDKSDSNFKNAEINTIPFRLSNHNNIIVEALINKTDTVHMMLHTGALAVSLIEPSSMQIQSIQWENSVELSAWGGKGKSRFSEANEIQIGGLTFEHVEIWENERSGPNTDGKFGLNLFEDYTVEINFDKAHIKLHQTLPNADGYERFALENKEGLLFLSAVSVINDQNFPHQFLLHSGYKEGLLYDDVFASQTQIGEEITITSEQELQDSFGNIVKTKKGFLPKLKLGSITLEDVPVGFFEGSIGRQKMSVFGGELIKQFNIIIDQERKNIYLKLRQHAN